MTITIVLPTVGLRSGAMAPAHARAQRSSIHPVTCWFVHLSSPPVRGLFAAAGHFAGFLWRDLFASLHRLAPAWARLRDFRG